METNDSRKLFEALLALQDGGCAVCKMSNDEHVVDTGRTLYVDHDHVSGIVRGLLCVSCNAAIGKLKDDPMLMMRALFYVTGDPPVVNGKTLEYRTLLNERAAVSARTSDEDRKIRKLKQLMEQAKKLQR